MVRFRNHMIGEDVQVFWAALQWGMLELKFRISTDFGLVVNFTVSTGLATSVACLLLLTV